MSNPALFHWAASICDEDGEEHEQHIYGSDISLRDLFAAAALTAFCSGQAYDPTLYETMARRAYDQADRMLERRQEILDRLKREGSDDDNG